MIIFASNQGEVAHAGVINSVTVTGTRVVGGACLARKNELYKK